MRKQLSKKIREAVYMKCNKHCAYCGCELPKLADMQVDHIESVWHSELKGAEVDNSVNNLLPACRQCNFYKSTMSIELFRERLRDTMLVNLRKNFNFRLALKYGFVAETGKSTLPIKFYYELMDP